MYHLQPQQTNCQDFFLWRTNNSCRQTIYNFLHITQGAGEEMYEIVGWVGGMGLDWIGKVDDRTSEEQIAGLYGGDLVAG